VLRLQQRYARVPSSPVTAAFAGSLLISAPLPQEQQVAVAVTFDLVQAPSCFALPVMQKRAWNPPFQVGGCGWLRVWHGWVAGRLGGCGFECWHSCQQ
jgi:hypothetical protein